MLLLIGCNNKDIQLNSITEKFNSFQVTDSLLLTSVSDEVVGNPMKMLYFDKHLIFRMNALPGDYYLIDYSLIENKIASKAMKRGIGPVEMINCDISISGDIMLLYDSGKQQLGVLNADSIISGNYTVDYCAKNIPYLYSTALLNDSILVGTNNFTTYNKLTYLNIFSGEIETQSSYSFLNDRYSLGTLIDASSCYVNIHPQTKNIILSYRYTDVIEFFDQYGNLKKAIQGPTCFDIAFSTRPNGSMEKTKETRKAFVNSYVTDNYIYLLYSGCRRSDENWSNGTELFIYSWEGKPIKRYILGQPIYAFAINELDNEFYTYSLHTGEILKGSIKIP